MTNISIICGFTPSLINFRKDLLLSLKSLGLEITAFGPQNDAHTIRWLKDNDVNFKLFKMQTTGLNPIKDLLVIVKFYKEFRRNKPDILFTYTIKSVIYASIAARLSGKIKHYALITGLGSAFEQSSLKLKITSRLAVFLYRLALKNAQTVFFQNMDDELFFRQNQILSNQTKSVIINGSGVNLTEFRFSPVNPGDTITFLLIARLLKNKGIPEFVEAARILKKKYNHLNFNILGYFYDNPNGISRSEMKSWQDQGLINYLGSSDDVRQFLENCSIYALPSYYREGTPRTILEAMAMGRPIITTDAPGCRETVIDGENGFLVKPRDVDSLVEAMEKFIQNPGLIPEMGKRSREIAEEKYDVHKVNRVILEAMQLI